MCIVLQRASYELPDVCCVIDRLFTFQRVRNTQSLQCVINIGIDLLSNRMYAIPLYCSMLLISQRFVGLFQLIKTFRRR